MSHVRELLWRIAALFGHSPPRSTDQEIRRELESHVAMQAAENVRCGMAPDEARRRALIAAGGLTQAAESVREQRGLFWLEQAVWDVRYAVRGLLARPLFTTVVVTTLALGVGVNVVMFGQLDRMLVRPPRYLKDPETAHRIYLEWSRRDGSRAQSPRTEYRRYLDFVRWNRSMSNIAVFANRRAAVGDGEAAREMDVTAVSANFFDFFDAGPAIGRYFTMAEDATPVGDAVAVLSYGFWQAQYARSANVIGTGLPVGTETYTIIGVAPRGFTGISDGTRPVVFIPATTYGASMRPTYYSSYSWTYVGMLARRKPDVSVATASADLTNAFRLSWTSISPGRAGTPADIPERPVAVVAPVNLARGPLAGPETKVAIWVGGVAVIVLLVACANVANLLLASAVRRRREIAVRRAIGGTPARLMRQVLTESLVLAALGTVAGVLAAQWTASAVQRVFADAGDSPAVVTDVRTLIFASTLALLAALAAGLAPALQSCRGHLTDVLKAGAREGSYRRSRIGAALLLVQTALSVVLLVGAGLFVRSLDRVRDERLGFDPARLVHVQTSMRGTTLRPGESMALAERLLAEARAIPGVASATVARSVPFRGGEVQDLYVQGVDSVHKLGRFELQIGSPEFFATMGTRILRGRALSGGDGAGTPYVAVVSEAMGTALWQGQDPVGQCFRIRGSAAPCTTVVGVAENIKTRGFRSDGEFTYYLPASQYVAQVREPTDVELFVRVNGDPAASVGSLRQRLQRQMPGASYVTVTPFQELLDPSMKTWTSGARMFMLFGALALLLAAIGLYGTIAFAVARRTQEIGMRVALGASRTDVIRLIVGEGMRITIAGVAIGALVALPAADRIGDLLFRVSPRDPLVFAAVAGTLLLVGILATALVLVALGVGLSRRAQRRERLGGAEPAGGEATAAAPAARRRGVRRRARRPKRGVEIRVRRVVRSTARVIAARVLADRIDRKCD